MNKKAELSHLRTKSKRWVEAEIVSDMKTQRFGPQTLGVGYYGF